MHVCVLSTALALACTGPATHLHGYGWGSPAVVTTADIPSRGSLRLGAPASDVDCGGEHTCAVTPTLRLRCFGRGVNGRLGYRGTQPIGDNEHPSAAGAVAVGAPVLSLGLGRDHTCAVTTGLRLRCFGSGSDGRLGLGHGTASVGDNEHPSVYRGVNAGAAAVAVAGGHRHSCCVTTGLQLRCWGAADGGSLGDGRMVGFIGRDSPASRGGRLPLGAEEGSSSRYGTGGVARKAVTVSSNWESSCATTANGEVLCWGGERRFLGYSIADDTTIGRVTTPAFYGAVTVGATAADDPWLLQLRWCDSHFGNGTTLRSTRQQQQLPACLHGLPFTLGLVGTLPPSGSTLPLRSTTAGSIADGHCTAVQPTSAEAVVVCRSGGAIHSLVGPHSFSSSHDARVRVPPPAATTYEVKPGPAPVTTSLQGTPLFPIPSLPGQLTTSRRRLLFQFGSSRPFRATFVVALDGSTVATTNRTQLWLTVATEGAHNLTVYTVDATGLADPSPLAIHWVSDFTPHSATAVLSGPAQPTTSNPLAQFAFGCSGDGGGGGGSGGGGSRPVPRWQQQCYYRVVLRRAGVLVAESNPLAATAAAVASGNQLRLSSVAALAGGKMSASRVLAFRVWGAAAGSHPLYRLVARSPHCLSSPPPPVPWAALASVAAAGGDGDVPLTIGPLTDGAYTLQLASSDGQIASSLSFTVDTVAPVTRVRSVARQLTAAIGDGTAAAAAEWTITASSWPGDEPPAVLWWRRAGNNTSGEQWDRVLLSPAGARVATAASTVTLQVKAEDEAGNVDAFPRTITWDSALEIAAAPEPSTTDSTATFVLRRRNGGGGGRPAPAFRWRTDGGHWHVQAEAAAAIVSLTRVSAGLHVFEAQPWVPAIHGSPDAVQPQPLLYTWHVISAAIVQEEGSIAFPRLADGPHELTVWALDAARNADPSPAVYRWTVDTTPPTCGATNLRPLPTAWFNRLPLFSRHTTRTLAAVGSEPLSEAFISQNGQATWQRLPNRGSDIAAANRLEGTVPPAVGDGRHTLWLKAVDAVGNAGVCARIAWVVDSTPPSAELLVAPAATGWLTRASAWNGTIAAHDSTAGIASVHYRVVHSTATQHGAMPWLPAPLAGYASAPPAGGARGIAAVATASDGAYSLWLKAVDAAGNTAVLPRVFNWTVDTVAPAVWLRLPKPPAVTVSRTLPLCFDVSEPATVVWWHVSAAPSAASSPAVGALSWVPSTASHCAAATVPSDGTYTLAVKAQDRAGNTAVNHSLHTWSVDTTAPTACSVSTPSLLVNSSQIVVTFGPPLGGPEGVTHHLYAISPAAAAPSALPSQQQWVSTAGQRTLRIAPPPSISGAGNQHEFVLRVRAVDGAGNVGSQPCASLTWTVDVTAPTTTVTLPALDGAPVRGAVLWVTLSHSEAVRSVAFHLSGMAAAKAVVVVLVTPPSNVSRIALPSGRSSSSSSSGGSGVGDGPRSAWFRAVDTAGNVEVGQVWLHWVLDTTPPRASLLRAHAPPLSTSRTLSARVRVADGIALGPSPGLWFATAKVVQLGSTQPARQWLFLPLVDEAGGVTQPLPRSVEGEIRLTVQSDGWFALALKAVDAVGNEYINTSAYWWGVDTTPPTSVIASVPPNTTTLTGGGGVARFVLRCTSSRPLRCPASSPLRCPSNSNRADCASYQYRLLRSGGSGGGGHGGSDSLSSACGGPVVIVPWTVSATTNVYLSSAQLTAGLLRFEARAVDAVGLVQQIPSTHRWLLSTSQEVVVFIIAKPPPLSAWHTASFTFQSTLAGRTAYVGQRFQVRLDSTTGPWQSLTSCSTSQSMCNHTLRGLSRGPHVLQVRSEDAISGMPSAAVSVSWSVGVCNSTAYAVVGASDGGALRCVLCPAGGDCTREGTTLQSMGALPGWWAPAATATGTRSPSTAQFYRCPLPDSCIGGGNASQAAACAGTFDSRSVLCGTCAASHVRRGESCTRCPPAGVGVTLMLLCTLLLVAFICFSASPSATALSQRQKKRCEEVAVLQRILISFLVTLTTIGDFRARGPKLVRDFIGLASTVSGGLSVRFAPIRCTLGMGFFAELLATLGMPWLLLTLCAVYVGAWVMFRPRFPVRQALVGCTVFTVFLVYPTVTRATLQVFRCSDAEVEGVRYLLHDLSVSCFSGAHALAVAISAACTAAVGLGVPALMIFRVVRCHSAASRAALKQEYQFLFDGYSANRRLLWWEALVLLRKFGLQCVEVFVADPTIQAAFASWLIVGALALHLWWQPYNSTLLNRLDALSLTVSYVTQALSSMNSVLLRSAAQHAALVEGAVTALLLLLNVGTVLLIAGLAALRETQQLRAQRAQVASQQQLPRSSNTNNRNISSNNIRILRPVPAGLPTLPTAHPSAMWSVALSAAPRREFKPAIAHSAGVNAASKGAAANRGGARHTRPSTVVASARRAKMGARSQPLPAQHSVRASGHHRLRKPHSRRTKKRKPLFPSDGHRRKGGHRSGSTAKVRHHKEAK